MGKVEYLETIIHDAYHGTSKEKAEKIITTGKFCISRDPALFLGDGVYFYEGSRKLAEGWARKKFSRENIGIIIAKIKLGCCLNLSIPEHRELIKDTHREIRRRQWKVTDAVVLNYFATIIEPQIDTIKCHFGELKREASRKIFEGSNITDLGYVVICVRKTESIKDFSMAQ